MFKKFLFIGASSLVALSLTTNWRAFTELKEISVILHLAAFKDHSRQATADSDHDHNDDADQVHEALHSHKHRHGPNEPEHEHATYDPGFSGVATALNFTRNNPVLKILAPQTSKIRFALVERIPSSHTLTSLFRPPIT